MEYSTIRKILGGYKNIPLLKNDFDIIKLSQTGLTKKSLQAFSRYSNIPMLQLHDFLPLSFRTIQRYKSTDHFNPRISEQVIQMAEVFARGEEVFENKEKFFSWLNFPHSAFDTKKPISLLSSIKGREMVMNELGRIEHGVYI